MKTPFPRILIYGQSFNSSSGGGITISNLFRGWRSENIAVIGTRFSLRNTTTDICNTFYQLGIAERKWIFPLRYFQRPHQSGLKEIIEKSAEQANDLTHDEDWGIISKSHHSLFKSLGLSHLLIRTHLSHKLMTWLESYKPEILYLQVSTRETILFANELIDFLRIPTVIHMMDDWPSTISMSGLFHNLWDKRIDREFRLLLEKSNRYLSISDAMSAEYLTRYKKEFIPFHNPVETRRESEVVNCSKNDSGAFRFLYVGRIGNANEQSIYSFAINLSSMSKNEDDLLFHVYTPDFDSETAVQISEMRNVNVFPPVKHETVHSLLRQYDVLLLPLDFSESGMKFARYSIPTKASEYMISGTPILVFAPQETAVTKFFRNNSCGFCLVSNDDGAVKDAISMLRKDHDYRNQICSNAVRIASQLFDAQLVRQRFQDLLKETAYEKETSN